MYYTTELWSWLHKPSKIHHLECGHARYQTFLSHFDCFFLTLMLFIDQCFMLVLRMLTKCFELSRFWSLSFYSLPLSYQRTQKYRNVWTFQFNKQGLSLLDILCAKILSCSRNSHEEVLYKSLPFYFFCKLGSDHNS